MRRARARTAQSCVRGQLLVARLVSRAVPQLTRWRRGQTAKRVGARGQRQREARRLDWTAGRIVMPAQQTAAVAPPRTPLPLLPTAAGAPPRPHTRPDGRTASALPPQHAPAADVCACLRVTAPAALTRRRRSLTCTKSHAAPRPPHAAFASHGALAVFITMPFTALVYMVRDMYPEAREAAATVAAASAAAASCRTQLTPAARALQPAPSEGGRGRDRAPNRPAGVPDQPRRVHRLHPVRRPAAIPPPPALGCGAPQPPPAAAASQLGHGL